MYEAERKPERWLELCEQAAHEQDSKKLMELIDEIGKLLEEKDGASRNHKAA